jgi:tetratricopeptide (TPR) repeat protein
VSRSRRRPEPQPAARPSRFLLDAPGPAVAAWATPAAHVVIALFGAALLAFVAGPHKVGDVFTESDFYGSYGPGALAMQHGHLDAARYGVVGPVYEMVLALGGFVFRDLFFTAELLSLAAMCATLLFWARIVRHRAGALAALVTVLLLAGNAQFFRYGWAATTDALALALQSGSLALLLGGPVARRRAALAGLVAGLAFLTRYNSVALLPAGVVALLLGWTGAPAADRRATCLAFAAGFLAPVAPWVGYSLVSGAHFTFQLHHNIAYEVFARSRGITWDAYQRTLQPQFPTPWSVLARDPGAVLARVGINVFDHLQLDAARLAGWPLALAALAGLALGRAGGALARLSGAWLTCALLFLTLVPAFHSERYSLAVLPAWAALASLAFTSPRAALVFVAGARRVWLKPALALLVLAPALATSMAFQHRAISQLPVEVLEVARQARPRLVAGERVYARKPHFAWVANLTATAFPFADSLSQLADAARRDGVRWIYYSWPEAELRPQFLWLLDTTSVVPGLRVRAASHGNPAVLYEIGPGFGRPPEWLGDPWEVAARRARAKLQIDNRDWRSRTLAAKDAQRRGAWAEAQPWLEQAHELSGGDPEVALLLADNDLHVGRLSEARALYEDALRADPGNSWPQLGLGWVALLSGDTAQAAALWRPMVPRADDPATLERMAELFKTLHDDAASAAVRARLRELGARP